MAYILTKGKHRRNAVEGYEEDFVVLGDECVVRSVDEDGWCHIDLTSDPTPEVTPDPTAAPPLTSDPTPEVTRQCSPDGQEQDVTLEQTRNIGHEEQVVEEELEGVEEEGEEECEDDQSEEEEEQEAGWVSGEVLSLPCLLKNVNTTHHRKDNEVNNRQRVREARRGSKQRWRLETRVQRYSRVRGKCGPYIPCCCTYCR